MKNKKVYLIIILIVCLFFICIIIGKFINNYYYSINSNYLKFKDFIKLYDNYIVDNSIGTGVSSLAYLEYKDFKSNYDVENKKYMLITNNYLDSDKILRIVEKNSNEEYELKTISSGLYDVFSANEISISQGNFISVFSVGHMGTGFFELYSIEKPYKLKYKINNFIVDRNRDLLPIPIEDINISENDKKKLLLDENGMARLSKVFEGDKLTPSFEEDINLDGHTDLVFRGIEKEFVNLIDNRILVISKHYCEYVYIYDENIDNFIYNKEYSMYEELGTSKINKQYIVNYFDK